MALSARTKLFLAVAKAAQRNKDVSLVEAAARRPLAERLATKPRSLLVGPSPAGVTREDRTVPGRDGSQISVRLYRARRDEGPRPVVVYLHGGGWVTGGLEACDNICLRLAAGAGVVVVSVAYRLAPEDPYPAALHDSLDVTKWVAAASETLGFDSARIAVAGDSAGGNLAAAVALRTREAGPALRGQVLIYPALDLTRSTPSARSYDGPGLAAADAEVGPRLYLGGASPSDPGVSPLLAADLAGLPPALIITAEYDCLRDEGRLYAERLEAAGVAVRHTHYVDYCHGFFSEPRMYLGVDQAWSELTSWVARTLHPKPAS